MGMCAPLGFGARRLELGALDGAALAALAVLRQEGHRPLLHHLHQPRLDRLRLVRRAADRTRPLARRRGVAAEVEVAHVVAVRADGVGQHEGPARVDEARLFTATRVKRRCSQKVRHGLTERACSQQHV